MEDMKDLMDGMCEVGTTWMDRLIYHSELVGKTKEMRNRYLKRVQYAENIDQARFYMNCYNQTSSLLCYYRESVSFDKKMLKEWIK